MKLFAIITAGVLAAAGGVYYFASEGCPFGGKTGCSAPMPSAEVSASDCCAVKAETSDCCAKVEACCEAVAPCCSEAKVAKAVKADCCAVGADCCAIGAACCLGATAAK